MRTKRRKYLLPENGYQGNEEQTRGVDQCAD
jgi:hypothetical protein